MKRNNDLILAILAMVEKTTPSMLVDSLSAAQFFETFPGLTNDVLNDHIQLLANAGFLEAEPHQFGWFVVGLTWEGHDFLANSKQVGLWTKAKQVAGHLSFDVFATAIKEIALQSVKNLLK